MQIPQQIEAVRVARAEKKLCGGAPLQGTHSAPHLERDKLYASLRDAIKSYAKFPIAENLTGEDTRYYFEVAD